MKNQLGLLMVLGTCLSLGCSNEGGKFGAFSSGGATTGGNGGTGGVSGPPPGEVRDSGLSFTGGGTSAYSGTSPFRDLTAPDNSYYDPNDPCTAAIPWVPGFNVTIKDGDLVQLEGKIYKYSTAEGSCNDPLTYTFAECIPTTTASWCKVCWIPQPDIDCPEVTVDTSILDAGTGGAGGATGSGGATSGT